MYFSSANVLKIVLWKSIKLCLSMHLFQSYKKLSLILFNINLAFEINTKLNIDFWIYLKYVRFDFRSLEFNALNSI